MTHSEPFEQFVARYGSRRQWIEPMLKELGANELRAWAQELGIETFVGTSGRVFPVSMKASPLLRAWLKRLQHNGVTIHTRHRWIGWDKDQAIRFETEQGEKNIKADAVILALGGGSWRRLGSDCAWVDWLKQAGVEIEVLRPSNCGFDVEWSEHFREKYDGHPIKSVILSFGDFRQQGEFIVTKEGVEGGLIYAASARMRDEIDTNGKAVMHLDLKPDRTLEWLVDKLSRPRGKRSLKLFGKVIADTQRKGRAIAGVHIERRFYRCRTTRWFDQSPARATGRAASNLRSDQQCRRRDI